VSLFTGEDCEGSGFIDFVAEFLPGYAAQRLLLKRHKLVYNYAILDARRNARESEQCDARAEPRQRRPGQSGLMRISSAVPASS
jgi:hypothetical protein